MRPSGTSWRATWPAIGLIWLLWAPASSGQLLDRVQYSVPFERQDTIVWCWVASAKMVVESLGAQAPTQCDMLQQVYRAPCCANPGLCARGGYIPEVQNLIAAFGFRPSVVSTWGDGWSFFRDLRDSGAPLVVFVDNSHFVVVTGMRIVQSQAGPLGIVNIHDPFRGSGEQDWPTFRQRVGAVIKTLR